jgi:hypothetical protein
MDELGPRAKALVNVVLLNAMLSGAVSNDLEPVLTPAR